MKLMTPTDNITITAIISCFTNMQIKELIPKFRINEKNVIVEKRNFFFKQK